MVDGSVGVSVHAHGSNGGSACGSVGRLVGRYVGWCTDGPVHGREDQRADRPKNEWINEGTDRRTADQPTNGTPDQRTSGLIDSRTKGRMD